MRRTYTSIEYDTTFIEIKEKDGINLNSFLEIDCKIFEEICNEKYKQRSIYLLHYPDSEVKYSIGVIKYISDNYNINHLCFSQKGS